MLFCFFFVIIWSTRGPTERSTSRRMETRLQAKDVKRVQLLTPGFMMTRDDRWTLSDKHPSDKTMDSLRRHSQRFYSIWQLVRERKLRIEREKKWMSDSFKVLIYDDWQQRSSHFFIFIICFILENKKVFYWDSCLLICFMRSFFFICSLFISSRKNEVSGFFLPRSLPFHKKNPFYCLTWRENNLNNWKRLLNRSYFLCA